jgi:hypothetical protein
LLPISNVKDGDFPGGVKNVEFPGGVPRGREVNKKKGGGSVEKMFIGDRERGTF